MSYTTPPETLEDVNFDHLSERFFNNVYDTSKGDIRLELLQKHMHLYIPELTSRKLKILDAAGGFGQIAHELALLGHDVTLFDISENMIAKATQLYDTTQSKSEIKKRGGGLTFECASIQNFSSKCTSQFDLILFHGAVEWTAEPQMRFLELSRLLAPKGVFSLLFYNKDAQVIRAAMGNAIKKIYYDNFGGNGRILTPICPLTYEQVKEWFNDGTFKIRHTAGIRIFHDFLQNRVLSPKKQEMLLEIEMRHWDKTPYLYLGRHIHIIAEKL